LSEIGPLFLTGGSMGGLISAQQAELIASGAVAGVSSAKGVLSLCPPLAGSAVWDQAIDFRLSYDSICAGVNGGGMPSGLSSAPWLIRPGLVDGGGSTRAFIDIAASAAVCIGFELPSSLETSSMRSRRAKLLSSTGASDAFLREMLFYSTLAVSDIVYDPKKLGLMSGAQPFDTRAVDYGDSALNNGIRRLSADPLSRFELSSFYTPNGRIGQAKLLTVATSGDGLVVPEHLRFLENKVPTAQWRRALVQESTPSHCSFSDQELLASWEQLRGWTQSESQAPSVASLNSACASQSGTSAMCRFASAENLAVLESKIKPRAALAALPDVDGGINGDWYTPGRSGEGLKIEAQPDGRALVSFFTYPKSGESSEQMWLTGTGTITDNGIAVDDVYRTRGARFGGAFNAADVRAERWGSLRVVLTSCGKGVLSFAGPTGFGSDSRTIEQLSRQKVPCDSRQAQQAETGFSGNWYDATRAGEGLAVTVQNDRSTALIWFTYTPTGEQAWFALQAPLILAAQSRKANGTLYKPVGARFGTEFQANQVRVESFGTVELEFINCQQLRMRAVTPWGERTYNFTRLTTPLGTDSCTTF
jgi:hypothetical protein